MRAAPAFQISLHRFGAWQAAVWATLGLAEVAGLGWIATSEDPGSAAGLMAFAMLSAVGWLLARSLVRQAPADLRWDGQLWWLGRAGPELLAGGLSVAIDLGPWMLLRFTPVRRSSTRATWLPVQRRGLEVDWHALRCTVYSPVPPSPHAEARSRALDEQA